MANNPKVQVVISPYIHERLSQRASREGRSVSSLAAFFIEHGLRTNLASPAVTKAKSKD